MVLFGSLSDGKGDGTVHSRSTVGIKFNGVRLPNGDGRSNGNLKTYLQISREFSPMVTKLPEVIKEQL